MVCSFLEMCMGWMAFDWTVRSDTQETYRAALRMAEEGLHLLMHMHEGLKAVEATVRAEEEEAVRDSIMLQVRHFRRRLPGNGKRCRHKLMHAGSGRSV